MTETATNPQQLFFTEKRTSRSQQRPATWRRAGPGPSAWTDADTCEDLLGDGETAQHLGQ